MDEIIISDDCSSDGTFEFLNEYANSHSDYNIVIVKNCGEHGVTKNFENAYNNSTADILFFADQDDVWKQDKVEIFVKAFERYPECGLVFSDAIITDDKLNSIDKTAWDYFFPDVRDFLSESEIYTIIDTDYFVKRIKRVNVIPGMCMAVKNGILKNVVPFNSDLLQDEIISMYFSINSKICCVNKAEAYYRQHEDNVVGVSGNSKTRRNSLLKLIKNASMQLKTIRYDFVRAQYYNNLDSISKYPFLEKNYRWQKKRLYAIKSNSFIAFFKLTVLYIIYLFTDCSFKEKIKLYLLDLCLVFFVRKKKRLEYFQNIK